jgi:hypothetical protein
VSFRQLIRHRGVTGTASAAIAVVIAGGAFAAVSQGGHDPATASVTARQAHAASAATAANPRAASHRRQGSHPKAAPTAAPLEVLSVTPSDGAQAVNGAAPVKVTFNQRLSAATPLPELSPQVAGTWSVAGDAATFQPATGYPAGAAVTLTIPGGTGGVRAAGAPASAGAGLLAKATTVRFTTGGYSTLRLQQLLTQLGYLPLTWTPADPATGNVPATDANAQLSAAYQPPTGTFAFQGGYPKQLTSQWVTGKANMLDQGAVMAFENDNGIAMDGDPGPQVWRHLLTAVAEHRHNPNGYTYSLADQHLPERLRVYHNGKLVLTTLVNTGVPTAGTQDGTFPVYLRYKVTQMRGTNPDGTKYNDTVHWVSYFNGGDALHYFPRPGYGVNQSVGCVEMPLSPAETAWNLTTYGSLVTVEGPQQSITGTPGP